MGLLRALKHARSARAERGYIMDVKFCRNKSEKNVIEKNLTEFATFECNLKGDTSITDPTIIIEAENPVTYNYCFIPQFNRYYFITDIISLRTNIWEIYMHVDVLMSFKDQIKTSRAIMDSTENEDNTNYLDNGIYKALAKDKTDIIKFGSGLLESGEYILITAGG